MKHDRIIQAVRDIVYGFKPENDISEILYRHNCFYLLSSLKDENMYHNQGKMVIARNHITIRDRYQACQKIFLELGETAYAVIKGAVLSHMAYGGVSIRNSSDIDILISKADAQLVSKILLENGFVQGRVTDDKIIPFTRQEILYHLALTHQTAPFIKKTSSVFCPFVNVDINTDIFWGESNIKADMRVLLSRTTDFDIFGIPIKKLSPVMEFISLCMHHYKDMNSIYLLSRESLRLSLFCDLYFYLINNSHSLDIPLLQQTCNKLKVTEYVYYCVHYTNLVFEDDRLQAYLEATRSDRGEELLNMFGLNDTERRTWGIEFFDRLFDESFPKRYRDILSDGDMKKIQLNQEQM